MSQAKPMTAVWRAICYGFTNGVVEDGRKRTPRQRRRFDKKERRRAKKAAEK